MYNVEPILWTEQGVRMLDQRKLPAEIVYHTYADYREVARAIYEMEIRGAPAIGIAAAMGIALGVQKSAATSLDGPNGLTSEFQTICETFARTRPTAVDLFWAIERFQRKFETLSAAARRDGGVGTATTAAAAGVSPGGSRHWSAIGTAMVAEAQKVHEERRVADRRIGELGAVLMPQQGRVMTQCNAGGLATGGIGTALGVIRVAVELGRQIEVLVPETRPYLQGARLTAWELHQDGIPLTLITDNMVGHFLKTGKVGAVVVGADRIAANGDTANKIGTYPMAVLAREHNVPFYVAAPISTVDLQIASGEQIPIEERPAIEVTHIAGVRTAPDVHAAHPAFDVTPARFIAAIITERGVAAAPYQDSLRKIKAEG